MIGSYEISIISPPEFNDLVAEIKFGMKFGIIVSQESGPGQYDISVHSFSDSAADDFDFSRNVEATKQRLQDFEEALKKAKEELDRLQKKRI